MGVSTTHRVFVDSNVFYSRTLRDWLGIIYTTSDSDPFIVCWSEDVLADTIHHLRKKHPLWDGGHTSRIRDLIANTFETGRVADYVIDRSYKGHDPHDVHVHAATVASQADILLTLNVKHFPENDAYEVLSPDEFFCLVDDSMPQLVRRACMDQAEYWVKKHGECDLPAMLRTAQTPEFAERVRRHLQAL